MFYDFIYLAKGFQMGPKVWSTLNVFWTGVNSCTKVVNLT